ncbi:MAG TPA: hypothetical protein VMN04_02695 [Thermoanaerobaculia bacterium]|nr:hypothetical protein [Thermoanaerobaculia bacterium]
MRSSNRIFVLAALAGALAAPARAQTSAGQTVVVPSLPGVPNKEVRIAGEELKGAEMVGPELSFTGQVVQWEEGRSITMRFEDGLTRVVPVASTIIFPPDLRPGGMLTVLVRQTSDGRYRVTGLSTAMPPPKLAPPAAPVETPAAAPATVVPVPVPTMPPPPAPGPKGKTVIRASYLTVRGTIASIDKGTVTVVEKSGRERTLRIAEKAVVAEGLAAGDAVVLRVPLQKPFDGKTANRVERPKPPKTPPPSKFSEAQSPKN